MPRLFAKSMFQRLIDGYPCQSEWFQVANHVGLEELVNTRSDRMMLSLFQGYRPQFKYHTLGREVEALMHLKPHQRMCYYEGKLFGGYIAFLIDRILADCCERKPAYTASLNTSFLLAIPPDVPIMLRAWPVKVDGRKTFLEGSVQIPGKTTGEWVNAIKAEALFIEPKP